MKKLFVLLVTLHLISFVLANQIDIGIFASTALPNNIEIRVRPDFNITSIQTITGILYTVRWDDPTITITTQYVFPFFIAPQGAPVLYNGYYYQVFAAVPMTPLGMNANQEYIISSFNYTNGDCATFEIIEDSWTQANNGNVYLELVGLEVTGIIYQGNVLFGSVGGSISGSDTTFLGSSTGIMTLSGFNGSIITWQRKVNDGSWENVPGTMDLTSYSETPASMGDYYYRATIQNGTCTADDSEIHHIVVVAEIILHLTVFLEGAFQNSEMTTDLYDQNLIPLSQPYMSPPWNYSGAESVTNFPPDAVDWVLLELRESNGNASTATSDKVIKRRAAFILKNGTVKDIDGQNIQFLLSLHHNLYIVVSHRNHISVISANSPPILIGNCIYNFTTAANQALGGNLGHKEIAPGIWGMRAGDGNSDGYINDTDNLNFWNTNAGTRGYISSDYSMDSQIDNKDKDDLWYPNQGYNSFVPQ